MTLGVFQHAEHPAVYWTVNSIRGRKLVQLLNAKRENEDDFDLILLPSRDPFWPDIAAALGRPATPAFRKLDFTRDSRVTGDLPLLRASARTSSTTLY